MIAERRVGPVDDLMPGGLYSTWVWTAAAVPAAAAMVTSVLAPDPHGHWTEHLTGAALKATQLAVVLVLVSMLGWSKLRVLMLISLVVIGAGIVFQVRRPETGTRAL